MSFLYGLVDTARDERLYALVRGCDEYACLFAGSLDPVLLRASPHIVLLTPNCRLARAWQTEGVGQSWGIQCVSSRALPEVRRHFRHFLQAKLPDGEVVLFRFYDPRVWQVYIPTCSDDDLARWFRGIDEYRCETEQGGDLRYRLDDTGAMQMTQRVR